MAKSRKLVKTMLDVYKTDKNLIMVNSLGPVLNFGHLTPIIINMQHNMSAANKTALGHEH